MLETATHWFTVGISFAMGLLTGGIYSYRLQKQTINFINNRRS